jgi:DNA-binding NtrC family response regulator
MRKTKILAVDDERSICSVYQRALESEGYEISLCTNGVDALKLISGEFFDLILLDLVMAGLDGKDIIRKAQQISPETRIIVITAYTTVDIIVETIRMGAYDYIPKPFEIADLRVRVRKCLEHKSINDRIHPYKQE